MGPVVAEHDALLQIAARCRDGQQPTFLFFAAIHYLLLDRIEHELASFYPSVLGDAARAPDDDLDGALVSFCTEYEDALTRLVESRLVQTNAVQRAVAIRLGFAAIRSRVDGPVHFVDVGASAGIHLRFDRFRYVLGGRVFGDRNSPLTIEAELIGRERPPDLDAIPPLASATGIDLHPLDVNDPDDRRWLEALVWPDNDHERKLLHEALSLVAPDPPEIRCGDAVDVCPILASELPAGQPRVVFHAATRMHVPPERKEAFDRAVASLGMNAPLYWLMVERPPNPDPRPKDARPGAALYLRAPSGKVVLTAVVAPRHDWIELVDFP